MSATRLGLIALLALVAGLCLSCKKENKSVGPPPPPPLAPSGLFIVQVSNTTVTLHWQDNSTDEDGFRVNVTLDTAATWAVMTTVQPNVVQAMVDSLLPGTTYYFAMVAFNAYGESDRSNPVHARTTGSIYPNPPTNVQATAQEENMVVVSWHSAGTQDSFVVQRHDTIAVQWSAVGTTAGNITTFSDSTVLAATHYYYRVGSRSNAAADSIVWSADSASVTTLAPGVPAIPESLHTRIIIGTGVVLTWINVSHNATGIIISRQLEGHGWATIDTVAAGDTTYTDSLGDAYAIYFYELSAFNTVGPSPWTDPVTADYRLHSPGVIPLAPGNYWIYDVTDTVGAPFAEQRTVSGAVIFQGQDFYLITQHDGALVDSLEYLRNDSLAPGCVMLHWPLLQSDHPQLLFKYPATQSRDSVFVDGQRMEVLVPLPGESKVVNNHVYEGVIVYELFVSASYRVIYYVEPNTVGIIQEEHTTGPVTNPVPSKTLKLRNYHVE